MCGASVISLHTKSHCPSPCIYMRHSPAALIPISGPLAFLALIRLFEPSSSNATSPYLVPSLSRHWASCTEVGVPVLTKGQLLDDNLVFCSENHRNNRRLVLLMLLCIIKQRLTSPATGQVSLSFMPVVLTSAFAACPSSPISGWLELPELPGFPNWSMGKHQNGCHYLSSQVISNYLKNPRVHWKTASSAYGQTYQKGALNSLVP